MAADIPAPLRGLPRRYRKLLSSRLGLIDERLQPLASSLDRYERAHVEGGARHSVESEGATSPSTVLAGGGPGLGSHVRQQLSDLVVVAPLLHGCGDVRRHGRSPALGHRAAGHLDLLVREADRDLGGDTRRILPAPVGSTRSLLGIRTMTSLDW